MSLNILEMKQIPDVKELVLVNLEMSLNGSRQYISSNAVVA
jgi:hypothetical protein